MGIFRTLILPQNEKNLVHFKYKGGTSSITYEYLWSPLAEKLIEFVPMSIAPNTITLIALINIVVGHLCMVLSSQNFRIPAWSSYVTAVAIFIYQHLDNMDGKQARRTGTSSPMGMIFDHGSDAVVSFLLGFQATLLFQVSAQISFIGIYLFIILIGFSAVWNQYAVGTFKLGRINPIDQGLPIYSLLFLFGPFFPVQKLNQFHIFAKWNEQFLIILGVLSVFQLIYMNKDILKNSVRSKQDVLMKLWLPVIVLVSFIALKWKNQDILRTQFFPLAYLITFMWSRNAILVQLCYILKQRFHSFNRGTNFYILGIGFYLIFGGEKWFPNNWYFSIMAFLQFLFFIHFVILMFRECSRILGIKVFSITQKQGDPQSVKKNE